MLKPMLCQELQVNSVLENTEFNGGKVTDSYRRLIREALKKLVVRGYVAERKYDGTRVLAINEDGTVVLQNRHGLVYTLRLPDIVQALSYRGKWKLDSEVVYFDPNTGEEKFTPCQRRCSTQYPDTIFVQQVPVRMEVFDLLDADGTNMEREPYSKRKDMLWEFLAGEDDIMQYGGTIEYVPFEEDLLKAWDAALRKDREGLIVKRKESPYIQGDRSFDWLKVKNWRFELCNVVGFTPGERSRSHFFGSLVLEKDGQFRGCVGSGFNEWELRHFKDLFSDAATTPKPYSDTKVGEVYTAARLKTRVLTKYYQVTDNNVLRFPIFVAADD